MDPILVPLHVSDQARSFVSSGSGVGVVQRPVTRLQNNIKRPNAYIDGTI
jgi:hypothetical protein